VCVSVCVCCRPEVVHIVSGSESESETERTRDRQERDEFASRLKRKDEKRTRKVMSKSEQKVRPSTVVLLYCIVLHSVR